MYPKLKIWTSLSLTCEGDEVREPSTPTGAPECFHPHQPTFLRLGYNLGSCSLAVWLLGKTTQPHRDCHNIKKIVDVEITNNTAMYIWRCGYHPLGFRGYNFFHFSDLGYFLPMTL
ncbi:hypothetical protein MKX01_036584 [Papaver californicum]|nr:hypothetical protein MKX01_036584 [Papaver californicum]